MHGLCHTAGPRLVPRSTSSHLGGRSRSVTAVRATAMKATGRYGRSHRAGPQHAAWTHVPVTAAGTSPQRRRSRSACGPCGHAATTAGRTLTAVNLPVAGFESRANASWVPGQGLGMSRHRAPVAHGQRGCDGCDAGVGGGQDRGSLAFGFPGGGLWHAMPGVSGRARVPSQPQRRARRRIAPVPGLADVPHEARRLRLAGCGARRRIAPAWWRRRGR